MKSKTDKIREKLYQNGVQTQKSECVMLQKYHKKEVADFLADNGLTQPIVNIFKKLEETQ